MKIVIDIAHKVITINSHVKVSELVKFLTDQNLDDFFVITSVSRPEINIPFITQYDLNDSVTETKFKPTV